MEKAYKQQIRNEIFKRESEGLPIFAVAEAVEKIIRQQVASELEEILAPSEPSEWTQLELPGITK